MRKSSLREVIINYPFSEIHRWLTKSFVFRFALMCKSWICYSICCCKSAAFVSGLLSSQYLVNYAVVRLLTTYVTDTWETDTIILDAAMLKNIHGALSAISGVILTYISDMHIGRLMTVVVSTAFYIFGLVLLSFCKKITASKFWLFNTVAMVLLAVGQAGMSPLKDFLSDQLRAHEPEKNIDEDRVAKRQLVWRRVAWLFSAIVAFFGYRYLDSWTATFVCSASIMGFAYVLFWCGLNFYHSKELPNGIGNPLLIIFYAVRAAVIFMVPLDCLCSPNEYPQPQNISFRSEEDDDDDEEAPIPKSSITVDDQTGTGRIYIFSKLEELKPLLTMCPLWIAYLVIGLGLSTADTFFAEQGNNMKSQDYIALLLVLQTASGYAISCLDNFIVLNWVPDGKMKIWRVARIWMGMLLLVICFVVAWRVEIQRLNVIISIFWLAPQFFLLGCAESLVRNGLDCFYSSQVPKSLQSYGSALNELAIDGSGNFLSIIFIQVLGRWFASNLKQGRLNTYYILMAILNFINLCCFVLWNFYRGYYETVEQEAKLEQSNQRLIAMEPRRTHTIDIA